MKICYLGGGTWGVALASVLATNGHKVTLWTRDPAHKRVLEETRMHPKLPGHTIPFSVQFTTDIQESLDGAELIVESITSAAIRPVFKQVGNVKIPIILTSKGIEQKTDFLLPEVISDLHNVEKSPFVGCMSGPSHAEEVVQNMPTALVCSAYNMDLTKLICQLFATPTLRIYPNADIHGVCFGGAMKNVIAIACGISDGITKSDNAKAALMTRGLHEMRKLCKVKDADPKTLDGLSGMGDLCVTCMSPLSRNYRFGKLIAEGFSPEGARQKIGMAVEGAYTCVSAYELGEKHRIPIPVTRSTYEVIFGNVNPKEALRALLSRTIKEEHL